MKMLKRLLLASLLVPALATAVDLRGRAVICVLAKDQSTYKQLSGLIAERRDALKIGYNPVTGKGIVIYDKPVSPQERKRLGIGDQALPCMAIVRMSPQANPEKVLGSPPAIQRNMSCLFEADLMISRLLNLESETYCVQRTGLSLDTVRYIRNLSKPKLSLLYCVGRNEEESNQLDLAYLVASTRRSHTPPPSVHVSEDALSDEILARLGTPRGTAPFLAVVTNSPEGNPGSIKAESLIRNIQDIPAAAEAMCVYQETGAMPTSVSKKIPPLVLERGTVENGPQAGGTLSYALDLSNVRPGPDNRPVVQVSAILKNSHGLEVARDQSNLPLSVNDFKSRLNGRFPLPARLESGDYTLELEVTELLSLQRTSTALPTRITGNSRNNSNIISQDQTTDTLLPGQSIIVKGRLTSPSGNYFLAIQGDGNLVIYNGNSPIWQSDTRASKVVFSLDQDGWLRLKDGNGKTVWKSNTGTGTSLVMQDDGRLVMFRGSSPIWSVGRR
ncbi:MAG: hypothetical protein KF760_33970 [Candidatus Eremiobacteraeota bacterium]|nr:hypothetical protein [Candidatus Eremiobacteraeota bacterium]MCW5869335.1 hypothetical protein [Candidatus Eremiobacteraeota bacterium]